MQRNPWRAPLHSSFLLLPGTKPTLPLDDDDLYVLRAAVAVLPLHGGFHGEEVDVQAGLVFLKGILAVALGVDEVRLLVAELRSITAQADSRRLPGALP